MDNINIDYKKCIQLLEPSIEHYNGVAIYRAMPEDNYQLPFSMDGYVSSLLEKGWVEGTVNGLDYRIEAPGIIFVPRHQMIEELRHSDDRQSLQLFLSNEYVEQLMIPDLKEHDDVILNVPYYPLTQKQLHSAQSILGAIAEALKSSMKYKDRYLKALVELWVYDDDIQQFHDRMEAKTENETVKQFLAAVKQTATEHKTVEYYAQQVAKSPSQLERLLRKHTGKTILQWVDFYKIEYCKQLLATADVSIAQLAARLHFSSPEYFCSFFLRKTGQTPSEYKKTTVKIRKQIKDTETANNKE